MKSVKKENMSVTETRKTDQQAIDEKMKALCPKILGLFCPVHYDLHSKRKVFVPYELMVFSYRIGKAADPNKAAGSFCRAGEIALVFDMNEVHGFHFDLSEKLPLQRLDPAKIDGDILPERCSKNEAIEKSKDLIRFKYLNRGLSRGCTLDLVKREVFYRPAWELTVSALGKEMKRFAWLDHYGTESENISGLKLRMNF